MKKSPLYVLIAVLAGAIGILSVTTQSTVKLDQSTTVAVTRGTVAGVAQEIATISVDESNGTTYTFDQAIDQNTTALDILQIAMQRNFITVQTKKYDFGMMVTSIDGITNGDQGKYWIAFVNGKSLSVAVDQYILEPGDLAEFKFLESYE